MRSIISVVADATGQTAPAAQRTGPLREPDSTVTAAAPTYRTSRSDVRWLMEVLTLAALYFLTARLGLLMAMPGGHVTPVWPPSGIALAAVLLRGQRVWPGIWLGSFAANFWDFYGSPMSLATELATSATFGIGASLTALLGSQLLRRFVGERNPLERVRDVCAFMALGGVASCLVSATVGVTTLCLAGFAPWLGYGQAWLTWWLGDTAGVFIVAPLLLVWGGTRLPKAAARWVELLGGLGLLIAVTYYVFIETTTVLFTGKSLAFILIPFLVWSAVRFGQRGAVTAAGLVALLAVWGTIHGSGPFHLGSRNESLLALELFLSVVSLTALCIAAVVMERRRVLDELESRVAERTAALRESEARFVAFMDHLPGFAWMKDLEGRYTYVNAMLAQLRPYRATWLGKTDADLCPSELAAIYRANDEAVIATGKPLQAVESYLKDGEVSYLLVSKFPILDATGAVEQVGGASMDITARKKAEEALAEQAMRYKTLMETSADSIYVLDERGDLQEANAAFLTRRGYTAAEAKSLNVADWDTRWTREQLLERLRTWVDGGSVFETQHRCKDGSVFDVEACVTRVRIGGQSLFFGVARDITERKRAERALQESDERFRQITENINEIFWVWTVEPGQKHCLYVSPAYATIWGRSCESLYAAPGSWREALHPNDKEWVLAEFTDPDVAKPIDLTYRIVRSDQSIRWIRDRIFPVRDARGVVIRSTGIAEDITESKTIEKALESAEEQYHSIFNNAVDGIFRTSPDGKFLVANPAAAHIFGFASPEELIEERRDIAQEGYVDPRRREEFKRLLQEQGVVNGFEYEAYRKDGSRVWISENTRAVHSPSGEILYFEGIFEDVTDRKEAEEALNAQALRYKTLMETSMDSIYVLDENGDLQEANAAFLDRRGYTAAEVQGLSVAEWDARWTREQLQTRLRKLAESGAVFETRHRCKDGSIFDVEVCATSVRIGEEQLFFCVTRDISTRKKAESDLRQLAQVSAASSDYIALIGRDFRYQFVNDTYLKARGLHLEDIIGRHMKEIVGQERFEQLGRPQMEACLRGEEVEGFEWTDFRSDLRCFLHVKVAPLREPDGTISGAVMSGRDITARYEAEQAQRESEERFRQLAENIDDIFWLRDLQHEKALYISPAYERIWGRTLASLYASPRSWTEALHPEDRDRILALRADDRPQAKHEMTYRIVRPDGSLRWIHQREFPVKDANGKAVRVAGIVADITERKEAEERRRRSEEKFKTLFGIAPVGISVLDRQHNIVDANPALEQITRLSREELLNGTYRRRSYLNADGTPKPPDELASKRAFAENRLISDETGIVTENGEIIWTQVSVAPLALPDASAVVITQDITERKRAAKELEGANDQLRFLSRRLFQVQEDEKRHLARELHDEMGQALTAVKINLQSARSLEDPADLARRLDESISIVAGLLNQTRRLSLDLRPPLLDDLGLVPALRSYLNEQAQRAGFRATFFADPRLERLSTEIETACFRVAQQALTNAAQHAQARAVIVELHLAPQALHLIVRDDGAGFDVDVAEERARRGGSLGLPGMRERLSLVGGELDCKSTPGRGTEVHAFLPLGIDSNGSGLLS